MTTDRLYDGLRTYHGRGHFNRHKLIVLKERRRARVWNHETYWLKLGKRGNR